MGYRIKQINILYCYFKPKTNNVRIVLATPAGKNKSKLLRIEIHSSIFIILLFTYQYVLFYFYKNNVIKYSIRHKYTK